MCSLTIRQTEFKKALQRAKAMLDADPKGRRILTVYAWNEWTEGSYLEPEARTGMKYLEALKEVFPPQASTAKTNTAGQE